MDHTPVLLAAIDRASRARLLRFVSIADPTYPWWVAGERVGPEAMPTAVLRDAAYCIADRFWSLRRSTRFWRGFYATPDNTHRGAPPGQTAFPTYTGAALDAWLALPEPVALPMAAE